MGKSMNWIGRKQGKKMDVPPVFFFSCFLPVQFILVHVMYQWTWSQLVVQSWLHDCQVLASLGGSVGCAVRLETRRSRVQPLLRSATFFRGDWSWNIFYCHSLPFADSRRAVVSFWRKNMHNTEACPVNVWLGKLTTLDMTPLGWLGRKTSTQTINYQVIACHVTNAYTCTYKKKKKEKGLKLQPNVAIAERI